MGTFLTRKRTPLGHYRRQMSWVPGGSLLGGGRCFLRARCPCRVSRQSTSASSLRRRVQCISAVQGYLGLPKYTSLPKQPRAVKGENGANGEKRSCGASHSLKIRLLQKDCISSRPAERQKRHCVKAGNTPLQGYLAHTKLPPPPGPP